MSGPAVNKDIVVSKLKRLLKLHCEGGYSFPCVEAMTEAVAMLELQDRNLRESVAREEAAHKWAERAERDLKVAKEMLAKVSEERNELKRRKLLNDVLGEEGL